ncbi:hypothetical protein GOP47_0013702 [Adiantum capillus-veneris]|uniref:OTU domain-containing protein n=1 Tax=Adiantum capillus-veneris TaxID=13818 RepID=A0A9D4UP82_ADICA|nr:hypothetical protein GOP47_0013702 [Adiantum capillus-veneris]
MGKLLQCDGAPVLDPFPKQCHSSGMDPWRDHVCIPSSASSAATSAALLPAPPPTASSPSPAGASLQLSISEGSPITSLFSDPYPTASWDAVPGLESQQIQALLKLSAKGVFWKHPCKATSCVFTLHHGGDVEADGNCLFSAAQKAMCLRDECPQAVRKRTVQRFLRDYENGVMQKVATDQAIKHLYSPDLNSGWGVHVVQEVKLLAKKVDREAMDTAIEELMHCSMSRENAAEMVYKERCVSIVNGEAWAKYMSIAGDASDEHDIITLLYAQEGLISVEENREGRAAAFGDDIAIESLASEYQREIFVVQAHGVDAMVDEEHCVFFLSHRPRGEVLHQPVFLFMKGTGWCGSGADHYEPLIAQPAPSLMQEKVALVL